jgi:hypothetical protein
MQINDKFSIEKYEGGWILTIREQKINRKTKEPIVTEHSIYPSTLIQCCERMMELKAGEATTLEGIITEVKLFKEEIKDWLKGVDIGRLTAIPERKTGRNKRIEAGDQDQKSNGGDEGKGTKGKVQAGNDSKSEQVPVEKKKRTGRKKGDRKSVV